MEMEPIGGSAASAEPVEPAPSKRPAPFVAVAMVLVAAVTLACTIAIVAIVATRDHDAAIPGRDAGPSTGPNRFDHWHAALGVNDCGRWVPNWGWPPGILPTGGLARAGSGGTLYAGLHSHGDGLIHIEPLTSDEMGSHATLGLYFRYGGWQIDASAVTFVGVNERNGNLCNGERGVLRWAVNGRELHGDPAAYKIADGDVIELVFTRADASLPPQYDVPSYPALREILGLGLTA